MTQIIGSGGGGGKGDRGGNKTPTTAPDSLESKSYAKVLDLISEGPIEGLKDGDKSIYLDNTPLQNSDGTYNFENVTVEKREGHNPQTKINGFDEASNTVSVNTEVTKTGDGTPGNPNIGVTRTVSTSDSHDAVRVLVRIPALQQIEDDGDIVGTSVSFKIQMQTDGGGFVDKISETVTGRTGDQYKKSYLITLPSSFNTGVEIRILRETDNSGDAKLQNSTWFDSYVVITYTNNTYPDSALVALRINAEQFSSIPQRSYIVRGIKTKIPNNCTVDSATGRLIYDGTAWNGTFLEATWNSCPAFALYDLLTSGRYGLGDHISESQLSKFDFYAASKYANELVSDGFGGSGQEARFSCNVCIRSRAEAFNLINSMTSVFRAMSYWSAGSLALSQDKPVASSSCLFTLANVTPEGFVYQGSSQKTRSTTVVVKYFDMNLRNYAYEEVVDTVAENKYGKIVKNVEAFACTSRGQAHRVGKWMLYSETQETETVTFATSIDSGVICRPGQVIDIADPVKSGFRRGGRIKAATVSDITVDGTNGVDTDLPQGSSVGYTRTLHIVRSNGAVESRPVSNISGSIITVETDFTDAPNVNGLWILETTGGTSAQNIETTQWRVISVTEEDGNVYAINALSYNSSKYANVESGIALTVRDFSNLNEIPAAPVNLRIFQQLYKKGNEIRAKIVFSWDAVLGVNEYEVRTRKDNGTWKVHRQQGPDDEILDITSGTYEVKIFSLNAAGIPSTTALTGSVNAAGKTRVPSDVTNFAYTLDSRLGFILHWDKLIANYPFFDDLDVVGYEIRTTDAEWGLANNDYYNFVSPVASENLIARVTANSYKLGYTPPGSRSYYVKAYDSEDRYSLNAASVSIAILAPVTPTAFASIEGNNVVITWAKVSTTARYAIDYYQVSKSPTFATVLEELDTTVYTREVDWTGAQTFYVRSVDIAGNVSVANSVTLQNTKASNYVLTANYDSGTSAELNWSERHGGTPTVAYQVAHSPLSVTSFGDAIGNKQIQGTTFSFVVTWNTARRFWIRSIDAQGNTGNEEYYDLSFTMPNAVASLDATFKGKTGNALLKSELELTWDSTGVKGSLNIEEYEIRRGTTFSSATVISTIKSLSATTQVDWNGTQYFWVVAKDINGNYGTERSIDATVTPPAAVGSFSQEVIDNNVLLNWSAAESILPILYYNIKKGSSYASGSTIGTKQGLFTTVFETISGTFTYWIAAIDSANNVGTPEQVSATVNQPPDYILRKNINSTFVSQPSIPTTVTSSNAFADQGVLFVNVDTSRTYQEHFVGTGSVSSPQYPNWNSYGADKLYGLPSATSGFYQEILDYGTTLAGTKIVSTLTATQIADGSTSITPKISISSNNSSYTDYAGTTTTSSNSSHSAFGTSFRYVKFRYDFASAGNDDLLKITAFNMRLETKQKTDSGSGTASASDSGGTTVNFSSSVGGGTYFVDVVSITVTPKKLSNSNDPVIAIYDFTDTPNPTSFKVLLYDKDGSRVSGDFSWTARGN